MNDNRFYAKPDFFEEPPVIKRPDNQDLQDIRTIILNALTNKKLSFNSIADIVLVDNLYSSNKGMTGDDVRRVLDMMEANNILKSGLGRLVRPPVEEEEIAEIRGR